MKVIVVALWDFISENYWVSSSLLVSRGRYLGSGLLFSGTILLELEGTGAVFIKRGVQSSWVSCCRRQSRKRTTCNCFNYIKQME